MKKNFIILLVLMFSFGVAVSALACGGEPTSCYKWSYNDCDGYVADRGDYLGFNYEGYHSDSHDGYYSGEYRDGYYSGEYRDGYYSGEKDD